VDNKVILHRVNDVYLKIQCEKSTAYEISDFFTFFVPGFQFTPAFRNKTWDGKIRLFDTRNYQIYFGLIEYLKIFCEERNYEIEYANFEKREKEKYSLELLNQFIEKLKISSRGKPIEVRDYQVQAFHSAINNKRGLFISPTASGKSLIIYLLIRFMMSVEKCKKGLIIVPTTSLVEQLSSDFADYSELNGFEVSENVHKIYQGKDKVSETSKLYVSTWQSIYNMPKEYFEQFDFVIGDEAHLFKAQSLTKILTQCVNTKFRVGLTGTLDGSKTHKLVLEGLFGKVEKVITTKELMDRKQVADFKIKCLVLKYDDEICKYMKDKTYQEEMEYLVLNPNRNKYIKNLSVSLKGNSLILYQYVDKHGKILYDMIFKELENRKCFFVYGKTETETREDIRNITEKENDAIIIASYGTFSTGINIRNLHNIIFASPSKSRVRNLQSIGRSLRIGDNKTEAVLYDIADDLRYKNHINFTLKHFIERTKIYDEEKFSYKLYKIGVKNGSNQSNSPQER
jgi:superfamily II DNA or RNA helicase